MEKKYIVRLTDVERATLQEGDQETEGYSGKGAASADLAESGRRGSSLDGREDRRSLLFAALKRWRTFANVW